MLLKRIASTASFALVISAVVMLGAHLPVAMAACPGNVAVNPGLEDGFSERGAGEVSVANGWAPFWQEGPNQEDGYNWRPEYKPEDGSRYGMQRIHEGYWAQKFFNTFATHHAGIYQQIDVPAGSLVTAKAWAQAWSSDEDNPEVSKGGKYSMRVGIDTNGGTDPNASSIVWSEPSTDLDTWVELTVQAKASGGRVTMFLRGDAEWRVKHNDVYWDDVCVTYVVPTPQPTAKPEPTDVPEPQPTAEPAESEPDEGAEQPAEEITATPVPSTEPTQAPVPTPTQSTGTIRVAVFDDLDADGTKAADEPLLAGARIVLMDMSRRELSEHTTDGTFEPFSFSDLVPGNYILVETDPPGYASSSPNQWAATVGAGYVLDLFFADEYAPTVTPTAVTAQTETPAEPTAVPPSGQVPEEPKTARSFGDVSGIFVAMVALVIPFAVRAVRSRV